MRASRKGFPGGSCVSGMDDAVLQRFAVVLALVGVALHLAALAENPSQGFLTVGFGVLLLALALGGAPVTRELFEADANRAEAERETTRAEPPGAESPDADGQS